jgi:hypothetical protein
MLLAALAHLAYGLDLTLSLTVKILVEKFQINSVVTQRLTVSTVK